MLRKIVALGSVGIVLLAVASAADPKVTIREWDTKTAGAFPHDPAVAPDGALWYTGMAANVLGRLDVKTGDIKEYPLKTPRSGPHGLVADKDGNIWFTANTKAYIGKLDPKTGNVTEYPMPDANARDPHSLVFDKKGTLWFTVQGANFVGKLDPMTGKIELKQPATADSHPYGIVVGSSGVPFFCEFNSNKLASIDPATTAITEYVLPEGARPRRLTIAPDGTIYYSDYSRGYLGRLDPKTKKIEEWPSPGGDKSRPYGIAATSDGIIWYSESATKPNTVVRFDPKANAFASWPIPSGGGVVRNMVAASVNTLYLACSGVNKIAVVEIGK